MNGKWMICVVVAALALLLPTPPGEAKVDFKDGQSHDIDYTIHDEIFVRGTSGQHIPTSVTILPGGRIEGDATCYTPFGYISLRGGEITGRFNDHGRGSIYSGSVGGNLEVGHGSYLFMYGGTVHGNLTNGGMYGKVRIFGGSIEGVLYARLGMHLEISGGTIGGDLDVLKYSDVAISGGSIGGDLLVGGYASGDNVVVTIKGHNFAINGESADYGEYFASDYLNGNLTGTLSDGSVLNNHFEIRDEDSKMVLFFEPPPLAFDNQTLGDSNWSSSGNWDDPPDPGTAVPTVDRPVIISNGYIVDIVTAGQVSKSVTLTDTATLSVATAANPLAGDLTVAETVTVGSTATVNVYNTLTASTLTTSGTTTLGDRATLNADITAADGTLNIGPGAAINGSVGINGATAVAGDNSAVSGTVTLRSGSFTTSPGATFNADIAGFGGTLNIGPGAAINGSVDIDGATAVAGDNSAVSGSVTLHSGSFVTSPGATFNADIAGSGGTLNIGPGAVVNGSVGVDGTAVVLSDNSSVAGSVTVVSGSFTAGTGVAVGSLEGESTALDVGAGGITITDKLSLRGASEWTHTGGGNFTADNSATGNLMDGVTELVLNGGALAIVVEANIAPPVDAVAYYSFDNVSGTTVYNDGSGGTPNDAALDSGAAITTGSGGRIGEGMTIADETTQKLTANTAIDLADTAVADGAWTIATWFYNLHPSDDWRILARGGNDYQVIVYRGTNDLQTYVGTFYDSDYDLVPADGWHHLAAVGSGSETQFYIDGAAVGDVIPVRSGTDVKWIGNYSGAAFAEIIDEFYVFDRALTEAEIEQLSGRAPIDLPHTSIKVTVDSTLRLGSGGTTTFKGISVTPGVRLGISGKSDDIRLTNLTLGDGASLAADDRDTQITVAGVLSSVGSVGSLGGPAETYEVSLTLETGACYEWEFEKTGGVVSGDLIVVNGDLTLGDDWVLEFLPAAGSEWFDGTEQVDLFSFTGTLTGDLGNVLFDAPADWITAAVTLHEEINRGGTDVNYVYMTGLETVPEPGALSLLGLGGLALLRRRKP